MKIIAVTNQKGGVGKTTTTLNLAGALASLGRRVLLVDNDHQRSLTRVVLGDAEAREIDPAETVAAAYAGTETASAVARPTGVDRIDIVPGHLDVELYNVPAPWELPRPRQEALSRFLRGASHDVALIDCHPDLQACAWSALAAADALLVPCVPNNLGVHGLVEVLEAIDAAVARVNPRLGLVGIVVNHVDGRRRIAREFAEGLRSAYGARVFAATVPYLAAYEEAINLRLPVSEVEPRGRAASAIAAVADELLARLDAAASASAGEGVRSA